MQNQSNSLITFDTQLKTALRPILALVQIIQETRITTTQHTFWQILQMWFSPSNPETNKEYKNKFELHITLRVCDARQDERKKETKQQMHKPTLENPSPSGRR